MKGCICLDIDGTITADPLKVPKPVLQCLQKLYRSGWEILFATGRSYFFAMKILHEVDFPFYLAVQNGSDVLQMPERKLLFQNYLSADFVLELQELYAGIGDDFIIYSGWERGDFCYYRTEKFSLRLMEHLQIIQSFSKEPWQKVTEYRFVDGERFPLIKTLGTKEDMHELNMRVQRAGKVESTYIKDPVSEGVYENLITAKGVTKGRVLEKMRSHFYRDIPFVAAGDDLNDLSMLQEADIAIVMESAPSSLLPYANIIAKSAANMGIIAALEQATGIGKE
jgi:HAD superfamily hydrolase (TIGR01484 family)